MRRIALTTSAIALFIGAAACSSTPEPEPVQPEPVVETNTAPVEPVQEETIEEPKRVVDAGPAAGSIQDFTVNVGDRVYFDLDQASLDPDDQEILQRQAAWLQSYPNVRILVAGNCDERGTREYNLALGARRANTVKQYLLSLGVDPARIDTVSYGKERPIDSRSNEAAWALNRNGFTQILSGASS
ncbi:peptidoglycan-associated lipoprotein Pal [Henriciella mobilis]|uniref:Peptidoglycan-associated lipoprotein n=1 Tax=Henriciella mobilis TaxID=2305467 RepID=A0A399RL60_9PROT|nr:peptidoglycan-associated lipoprotein Pal [Henriciella mobilis]RIJ18435.1 peptidoglycan-associated lipoprotein Pal [Henriciella mobilis]RIJ25691.1 peptidoglycan-associated lipoprotein Pal [Henriciella mobilis]RIJ30747.1 peptidoglycan-associated lipoprotein Pal [Henriciella mobilis]